jgi:hypothetical protein
MPFSQIKGFLRLKLKKLKILLKWVYRILSTKKITDLSVTYKISIVSKLKRC